MRDLEELKTAEILKDYAEQNLTKGKGGRFYHCPACGDSHPNATLSLDGHLFKCFYEKCQIAGSVIDLIKYTENLSDKDAIRRLRELYDPTYSTYFVSGIKNRTKTESAKKEGEKTMSEPKQEEITRNFVRYYGRCHKRVFETNYTKQRGLDEETVNRFNLGYDPNWTSPTAEYNRKQKNKELEKQGLTILPPLTPSPRLIIPVSDNNYLARDIRPDDQLTDTQQDFRKMNEGKNKPFFNLDAMKNPLCFFVTEGELDAISIEQAGGPCVALGSTVKAKAFGELIKGLKDPLEIGTVIISLDNDQSGQNATETIIDACIIAGIDFIKANVAGQYKDANEHLVNDRQSFDATVRGIVEKIRTEKMLDYAKNNSASAVADFMNRPLSAGRAVPTGFKNLDKLLNGGLCSGLVFVGGLSSIGKTTLCLQMAESIATNKYPAGTQEVIRGRDVLYFALEQSKNDLLSKILSRRTYLESVRKKDKTLAKMNFQLLQREPQKDWPQPEWDALCKCYGEFKRYVGQNLYIIEPKGDMTAEDIVRITDKHVSFTGRVPIIFVDYLQILKSIDVRATDKQAIDRTLIALGSLARKYNTTVVGISSFNRENYWQKVNLTAFKDSGNLEYSADMLFAIAPAGMEDGTTEEVKTANKKKVADCRDAEEKQIQLHVLKTRSGMVTGTKHQLFFTYHAKYNHFEEKEQSYLSYFDKGNPAMNGKII